MGSPIIFNGSQAKLLKPQLAFFDQAQIISGTTDPSSVATDGVKGSLYLNTSNGNLYSKQDNGATTNWVTVGSGSVVLQDWASQTNFSFPAAYGTVTAVDIMASRINDNLYVRGTFQAGTVTTGGGEIILPAGLTINTNKLSPTVNRNTRVGTMNIGTSASAVNNTTELVIFTDYSVTDRVYVSFHAQSGAFVNDNVNSYLSGGEPLYFDFNVPIVGWGAGNGQDYT